MRPGRLSAVLIVWLAVRGAAAQTTAPAEDAERLFIRHCAACHGPHGEGGRAPTLAVPQLPRARDRTRLSRLIEEGLGEMPRTTLPAADVQKLADWVLGLGRRPVEVLPGDAAGGERLFFGAGGCTACHALQRHGGGALGPDLTDIGLHRGTESLRRSLTDPGAEVPKGRSMYRYDGTPQNFLAVRARTRAGRLVDGVRVNEDTFSIQIRDGSGSVHSFFKSELAELHKDWGRSPMPAYGAMFTAEQMDDMVAYLASLRGRAE
jgi:cytochrome c oxidase cbb3-type subunit 3